MSSTDNAKNEAKIKLLGSVSYLCTFIFWMYKFGPHEGFGANLIQIVLSAIISIFTFWIAMIILMILGIPCRALADLLTLGKRK